MDLLPWYRDLARAVSGLDRRHPRQIAALTHADRLSETVVDGKRVWHKYNCNDCHTILGFGSYYGPDVTKVHWRRGGDGIKAVVRDPEQYTTWREGAKGTQLRS
jgi:nitric oxide reductase large subunit